jgi:CheY-like chemotaxis protein
MTMTPGPRRILLVDDLRVFLELERSFLQRAGFEVETASSGPEAVEKARALRPAAILLDLYMPGFDGAECCRQIKRDPDLRGTPVVIITSKALETDRRRCIDAGCDGFISKIAPHSEILVEIEKVISRRIRPPGAAALSLNVAYALPQRPMRHCLGFDLGPDGMFVASPEAPPRGAAVRLEIELGGLDRRIRLGAQVIRSEAKGEGLRGFHVRFIDPEPAAVQLILEYLGARPRRETRCPSP